MAKVKETRQPSLIAAKATDAVRNGKIPTHLILTCMDYRHMDDLVYEIVHELQVPDAFDHLIVPGGCLGVLQQSFRAWGEAFWSQLAVAHKLHGQKIRSIWLIEHMNCGAYRDLLGALDEAREELMHRMMGSLLGDAVTKWCQEKNWRIEEVACKIMRPTTSGAGIWELEPLEPIGEP